MAKRLAGRYGYPAEKPFAVTLHPERLEEPLHWKKPRRIFVNSMSDLFHPDVPDEFIDKVFAAMALCPQHTFQILTKRPERMAAYLSSPDTGKRVDDAALAIATQWDFDRTAPGKPLPKEFLLGRAEALPLPNVWLGTSVENQEAADERIPFLLQTPAAIRFLSCEPLLGPVDLWRLHVKGIPGTIEPDGGWRDTAFGKVLTPNVDWVIVGGESGPGARPMHPDWARSLRDQCKAAGVAFLFKQWGEWGFADRSTELVGPDQIFIHGTHTCILDGADMWRCGKKRAGRLLDGRVWDEYPEVRA